MTGYYRYVRITVIALGLFLAAGCSSESVSDDLKPLSLTEQASTIVKSGDGYVVNWAGVLSNVNPAHFGEHVVATVIGRDAGGGEVVRMDQPLDAVPPNSKLAFTGQATASAKPVKVSIEYRPAQWRPVGRIVSAYKTFPASRVETLPQKDGDILVVGAVANPYRLPASSLVVSALLRDATGRLLGGGSGFVDNVRAGSMPRFLVDVEGVTEPSKVAKTEVVVRTWGSTSKPYEDLVLGGSMPVHTVKPTTEPFQSDRGQYATQ